MVHGHPVIDTDHHFIIDPITRSVTNAELKKTTLIQLDHNSERFSFELDRYVEGHDMSLCNKIEVHYTNTNGSTRAQNPGVYEVDDFEIADSDESKVVFTWLISENATLHPGSLSFLILFACEEAGVVTYRWHTGINNSISVGPGMNNGEVITESFPDILAQWKSDLYSRDYSYEGAVKNGFEGTEEEWYEYLTEWAKTTTIWDAKQNNVGWVSEEDIDKMFEGTYSGFEDETSEGDYDLYAVINQVNDNLSIFTKEADGERIDLQDSVAANLEGLAIFGKTTQKGTPSFEKPQELVKVGGEGGVTFAKENSNDEFTINIPDGLSGIPVDENHTYSDDSGQKWYSDEVNLVNDSQLHKLQRVETFVIDGTEGWLKSGLAKDGDCYRFYSHLSRNAYSDGFACDKLKPEYYETAWTNDSKGEFITIKPSNDGSTQQACVSILKSRVDSCTGSKLLDRLKTFLSNNPITIQYRLITPMDSIIDLTNEEIKQFKAFRLNTGNTVLYNSDDAYMRIKYAADAKLYLEEQSDNLYTAIDNIKTDVDAKADKTEVSEIRDDLSDIAGNVAKKEDGIIDAEGTVDLISKILVYDKNGKATKNVDDVHSGIFRVRLYASDGSGTEREDFVILTQTKNEVTGERPFADIRQGVLNFGNAGYYRTIDDLSADTYPVFEVYSLTVWDGLDGEGANRVPLSANQGYALDQKKEDISNKSTAIDNAANDTSYPTTKAVKDYVDAEVDGLKDYVAENTINAIGALKGSATGNPIRLDDVSPIEHEMKVSVDTGGATVKRSGKNLYPSNETLSFPANNNYSIECNIPQPFALSCTINQESITNSNQAFIELTYDDESVTYIAPSTWTLTTGVAKRVSVKYTGSKILKKVKFINWGKFVGTIQDVMAERGTVVTDTDYESYVEPTTYVADENGNVDGVTSLYPTTVLSAVDGVTITAEYNRDIDKVIAGLENAILSLGGNV